MEAFEIEDFHPDSGQEGKKGSSMGNRYDEFAVIVDQAKTEDSIENIIMLYDTLNEIDFEFALPSFGILVTKELTTAQKMKIERLIREYLFSEKATKTGTKAALSALKVLVQGSIWNELITLLETFEEPQFHIVRPVLPLFQSAIGKLNEESRKEYNEWIWTIVRRASLHTNGWIRLWAMENGIDYLRDSIQISYQFLPSLLIDLLNSTDILWRLIERSNFENHCEKLGKIINDIIENQEEQAVNFLESLLESISRLTCPFSLFYVSEALKFVKSKELLGREHSQLFREIFSKLNNFPYQLLKKVTTANFVDFFAKMIHWAKMPLHNFVPFTSMVSLNTEDQEWITKRLRETISNRKVHFLVQEELHMLQETQWNYEIDDPGWLFWTFACSDGLTATIQVEAELERKIVELIDEALAFNRAEALMHVWLRKPDRVKTRDLNPVESSSFSRILADYLSMRLFMLRGTLKDQMMVDQVLLPLALKFPELVDSLPKAILELLKQEFPTEQLSIFYRILEKCLEKSINLSKGLLDELEEHFKENPLSIQLKPKSINELTKTEYQRITEKLHNSRTRIYRLYYLKKREDKEILIEEALEALECASLFKRKLELLRVIEESMDQIKDGSILISCIEAGSRICDEEQKSLNFLPSIRQAMKIAMHRRVIHDKEATKEAMDVFDSLLKAAGLSHPVAVLLAQSLRDSQEWITKEWTSRIVNISIFGPIPNHACRVLKSSYSMIFDSIQGIPNVEDMERLHEIVARTRMISMSVAVQCSLKDPDFANSLILEIMSQCEEMDKSSNRSFGLSYAHRGKTRSLQMMLLSILCLENKDTLTKVIDSCILFLIDPCQQFSIKLIVEWILVVCANRDEQIFEKIIHLQQKFASTRIGSVTSWLNILVLFARGNRKKMDLQERLLKLMIPWTSAQNFAVRCTAIAACSLIYSHLSENKKKDYEIVKSIIDFDKEPAGNSRRIIDNLLADFYFAHLNPVDNFDVETILRILPEKTGMPEEELIPKSIIVELNETGFRSLSSDDQFLKAESLVYNSLAKCNTCAPDMSVETKDENEPITEHETSLDPSEGKEVNLQRKLVTSNWKRPDDCSLIVIASLVDKPANLGGLCRTCEIFSVDTLILSDSIISNDTNFRALSMSSEYWQKMETVKRDDLYEYLIKLKGNGYTIIGAEQTTNSIQMHQFLFPKKCALLVGDEREGIPTKLLRYIDQTVEITQFGQTRSLNVHVTAALFISKFAEQHFCK